MSSSEGSSMNLPLNVKGIVVKGFGRGSKELNCPTANFSQDVVDAHSDTLKTGVYYGWARVDNGEIHKMVMCVGWNPYYKNTHKSMETHIMHSYANDFYGSMLRVSILGYIRPEENFKSLDDLISKIQSDINYASVHLDNLEEHKNCDFLTSNITNDSHGPS